MYGDEKPSRKLNKVGPTFPTLHSHKVSPLKYVLSSLSERFIMLLFFFFPSSSLNSVQSLLSNIKDQVSKSKHFYTNSTLPTFHWQTSEFPLSANAIETKQKPEQCEHPLQSAF